MHHTIIVGCPLCVSVTDVLKIQTEYFGDTSELVALLVSAVLVVTLVLVVGLCSCKICRAYKSG